MQNLYFTKLSSSSSSSSITDWFNQKTRMPIYFLLLISLASNIKARELLSNNAGTETAEKSSSTPSVSAVLIFGDSTADPGNNNYIATAFKSNFPPYGKDFDHHKPTGRFTNGRLANDYIANYLDIKDNIPPYLDFTLSVEDLKTGVSFASAGTGFDPLTPTIGNVISLKTQLQYFKDYQARLESAIGKDKTEELINNALFLVSAGTNDFVVNYFSLPIRRKTYTVTSYETFVIQQVRQFVQELVEQGARRIGVVGLPPMGCLPFVITVYSDNAILKRGCIDSFSSVARDYNQMLEDELNSMQNQTQSSGTRIAYMDVYRALDDMTSGHKYDFDVVRVGCCGTGLLETSLLCNPKSSVCGDADKYVFWDSIHPSEKAYELLFEELTPTIDYLVKG